MIPVFRIHSICVPLLLLPMIMSCSLPQNHPPWPVTGPTDPQELTEGTSFKLEVSDFGGIIDDPGMFDPDGDDVMFTTVLTEPFEGLTGDPDVVIDPDGTFRVENWDAGIAGFYGYYSVTITDGRLSRTTGFIITVYFY